MSCKSCVDRPSRLRNCSCWDSNPQVLTAQTEREGGGERGKEKGRGRGTETEGERERGKERKGE